MTASSLDIRPLRPDDNLEAELDLRRRAFGPISAAGLPGWLTSLQRSIEAGQLFGVFDGPRLVGSARYFDMRQWWLGRSLPMAGVAGVKVAPEERGRGVGRALMNRLLSEIAGLGYPVSMLFPATMPLYRSMGWEIAGGRYETLLPASLLTGMVPPEPLPPGPLATEQAGTDVAVRPVTAADAATVVDVIGTVHRARRDCGPSTDRPAIVADWLDDPDHYAYLADDGFLSYRWGAGDHELQVDYVAAASAGTARAFWRILGSHASTARTVRAGLAPDDPVNWLMRERGAAVRQVETWMLRVLDPAAAFEARGYPAGVTATARLDLADHTLPANSGRWLLEVSGGAATLAPAPAGDREPALRLGARGLASLFAGVPAGTLRIAGLASGGTAVMDEALDSAFACRPPFVLYDF